MSTSNGSTTMGNINARQVNSEESIRNRQDDEDLKEEDEEV